MKKYSTMILYLILFIYLELVNRILMFNKMPGIEFCYVILFSLSISILLNLFTKLFDEKKNKIICSVFVILITILYIANFLYFALFSVPFSISDLELMCNAASDFHEIGFHLIVTDLVNILLFLIPIFIYFLYRNHFDYTKKDFKNCLQTCIFICVTYMVALVSLNFDKENLYSAYNLYYNIDSLTTSTDVLGVLTSERLSIKRNLFGFKEKIVNENKEKLKEQEKETTYNQLDINFDELIANESDDSVKSVYEYLKNKKATNQNEYTGMYKGKNLIFILAEGFNSIAVDKERTPTLYKMVNEGFNFTNYYSPVFLSTTGGEFQAMTSLIPSQEILGMWRKNNPYLPYAIGNAFASIGYNTSSYHNWTYTYYNRDNTMPTLGFTNYMGCGNGLEKNISCKWVPSDVDLINTTFDNYAKNEPFVTYYISVSGHAPYNFTGGNSIAIKNKEVVANLPYSDSVKAYLASQMELEYALNALVNKLNDAGILEDTVIVLTGDHYPYTLTEEEINEISDYERDEIVEVNHSNLIIWNNKKEDKKIEKVASQIDVLPTILNLFGIEYDSRLLIGNDIFSDEEGLAIFSNRSWRSDKGTFYKNKEFVSSTEEINEDYLAAINSRVANSFTISKFIIEKDIYRKIFNK